MSARDAFAEKFRLLLREIPDNYTLPQWQFLYRQVIFTMGMRILERFPHDAVGPDPFSKQGGGNLPGPLPGSPAGGGAGGTPGNPPPMPIAGKGGGQGLGVHPDTKGGGQGGGGQPAFVKFVLGLQEEPVIPPK